MTVNRFSVSIARTPSGRWVGQLCGWRDDQGVAWVRSLVPANQHPQTQLEALTELTNALLVMLYPEVDDT